LVESFAAFIEFMLPILILGMTTLPVEFFAATNVDASSFGYFLEVAAAVGIEFLWRKLSLGF